MIGAKWYDMVIGIDIHWVLVPAPPAVPIPTPLPHPFTGMIFDPVGLAVGTAISAGVSAITGGGFGGPVLTNFMPAANTGTDATNMLVCPHFPMPPGIAWAPVPAGLKPPIPGKAPDPGIPSPIPSNDATMITGSKTVYINGTNACRLGDLAMSCGEPIRLPSSTVIAIPMGAPVLVGGPPALDFFAAFMSLIKTQWVSGRLHSVLKAEPGSWKSKAICFLTGHPVDVMSGMVLTEWPDLKLPGPIPFELLRSYASKSTYKGPLGHGWGHSYDQFIRFEKKRVLLHAGDGRDIYFYDVVPGRTARNEHERLDLTINGETVIVQGPGGLRYVFGKAGRANGTLPLLYLENRAGDRIQCAYDAMGFLTAITDSAGRHIGFHNDNQGRLVRITTPHPDNPGKRVDMVRYAYDEACDLVAVYDVHNQAFRYAYKYHLLVQETNRNGLSFYFAYDGIDHDARCVRTWGDGGIYDHVLTYDPQNKVTVVENSLGHGTTYMGNEDGLVTCIMDPHGQKTQMEWDTYYRKISETDPLDGVSRWDYDERGNNTVFTNQAGDVLTTVFDKWDLPVSVTDGQGETWRRIYDALGRLKERRDPNHQTTIYNYISKRETRVSDPAGRDFTLHYDDAGNLVRLNTPDGNTTSWSFDGLGRLTGATDVRGSTTRLVLNLLGAATQVHFPDGNVRHLTYDGQNNVVRAKDPRAEIHYTYSGLDVLTARREGDVTVHFEYDTEEQLTAVRNEVGSVFRFERDATGAVIAEIGFDGSRRTYQRDATGRVTNLMRGSARQTTYDYDALGRVVGVQHDDGTWEAYAYRADGCMTEARNQTAEVLFERDAFGRITRETQGAHWVASEYDVLGRRLRCTSSLGASLTIDRNVMGDVTALQYQGGLKPAWETRFERDAVGQELERQLPGGIRARWIRDELGRPIQRHITGRSGVINNIRYQWDISGRLQEIMDGRKGRGRLIHDDLDNLAAIRYEDGSQDLRLPDAIGNLFRTPDRSDRTYGPSGALLENRDARGVTTYDYDGDGNLIRKTEPNGGVWTYTWNGAGMLVTVERPDGAEVHFTYDALARRVSKSFRGKTTRWVWDAHNPLHEWVEIEPAPSELTAEQPMTRPLGSTQQRAMLAAHPPNGPPADAVTTWLFDPDSFAPLGKIVGEQRYSIITNHLGTPTAMFNERGDQIWSADYDSYGCVQRVEGDQASCPFRFPGQYEDEETGLYYNRFRYYDPEAGTYISKDPLGQVVRQYAYVRRPEAAADPFGLTEFDWVNPNDLNYSQAYVTGETAGYEKAMREGDWDWNRTSKKGNPLAVLTVVEVDGQMVSMDNRRLLAAQNAGLDEVKIQRVNLNDIKPGTTITWGESLKKRLNSKPRGFDVPKVQLPDQGSPDKPKVCTK